MNLYPSHFGDNLILVVPVPYLDHTPDRPFCWDATCPCHEDQEAIAEVYHAYQDGLVSAVDAARIVQGRTV